MIRHNTYIEIQNFAHFLGEDVEELRSTVLLNSRNNVVVELRPNSLTMRECELIQGMHNSICKLNPYIERFGIIETLNGQSNVDIFSTMLEFVRELRR